MNKTKSETEHACHDTAHRALTGVLSTCHATGSPPVRWSIVIAACILVAISPERMRSHVFAAGKRQAPVRAALRVATSRATRTFPHSNPRGAIPSISGQGATMMRWETSWVIRPYGGSSRSSLTEVSIFFRPSTRAIVASVSNNSGLSSLRIARKQPFPIDTAYGWTFVQVQTFRRSPASTNRRA